MHKKNKQGELSYYGLSLLAFLKESHPELIDEENSPELIGARADMAAEAYGNFIKEGYTQEQAEEEANRILFLGYHFSRHNTLVNILWNEFDGMIPQSEAKGFASRILPECEAIFSAHPLSDEFAYSEEYDTLYTELCGFIDIWLEENECFKQREQSLVYLNYAESRKTPDEDEL